MTRRAILAFLVAAGVGWIPADAPWAPDHRSDEQPSKKLINLLRPTLPNRVIEVGGTSHRWLCFDSDVRCASGSGRSLHRSAHI